MVFNAAAKRSMWQNVVMPIDATFPRRKNLKLAQLGGKNRVTGNGAGE